ncbi:hypothetical protein BO86DRAFT_457079 [Aspergillus japonicus CBS 114.51]|uniref:Uncharacterized protein n=1 Tax=Aspergillus japonicus CBS 114.51 TaxID=1448312 RepID=A0A8T8WXU0_ASPJA|nr:hypothetical protein BO86DRAFT_457079 [Aspergillus japonicus CBS 114.51]RAH80631.1 hypothetical protein BO86DRAFT_457079 [Aspergillus japonicus CBS 114.51]
MHQPQKPGKIQTSNRAARQQESSHQEGVELWIPQRQRQTHKSLEKRTWWFKFHRASRNRAYTTSPRPAAGSMPQHPPHKQQQQPPRYCISRGYLTPYGRNLTVRHATHAYGFRRLLLANDIISFIVYNPAALPALQPTHPSCVHSHTAR